MTENKLRRIVWAVDALSEDKELFRKTVQALKAHALDGKVEIEPVYVLSPDQLYVPEEFFANVHAQIATAAREQLMKRIGKLHIPKLLPITVLASSNFSLRSAVHLLVEHAKKANAEMIVASTQSKKGVTRFLFGSFAETLVLQSEIPVLLVSPKTAPARKFRHIFFPTDLTDKSRQVFEGAIALAIAHKAKLTLFHKVEYLNEYSVAAFVPPINQEYLRSDLQRRKAELTGLAEQARARGVKVDIVLDSKVRSIVDSIVSAAKRGKADLIAMASQTGPVATALLGSVTRQLLRSATCPVWVVHPSGPGEINVNRDVHRPNEYIPNARARAGQAR